MSVESLVDGRQVDAYAVNELDNNMMHPLADGTNDNSWRLDASACVVVVRRRLRRLDWST